MSNAEHTGQALREQCARKRQKLESNGAEQGLIECRLKGVDAGGVMRAFYEFAANKKVDTPSAVEAIPGAVAAWPLQFHPRKPSSPAPGSRPGGARWPTDPLSRAKVTKTCQRANT